MTAPKKPHAQHESWDPLRRQDLRITPSTQLRWAMTELPRVDNGTLLDTLPPRQSHENRREQAAPQTPPGPPTRQEEIETASEASARSGPDTVPELAAVTAPAPPPHPETQDRDFEGPDSQREPWRELTEDPDAAWYAAHTESDTPHPHHTPPPERARARATLTSGQNDPTLLIPRTQLKRRRKALWVTGAALLLSVTVLAWAFSEQGSVPAAPATNATVQAAHAPLATKAPRFAKSDSEQHQHGAASPASADSTQPQPLDGSSADKVSNKSPLAGSEPSQLGRTSPALSSSPSVTSKRAEGAPSPASVRSPERPTSPQNSFGHLPGPQSRAFKPVAPHQAARTLAPAPEPPSPTPRPKSWINVKQ